jgi:hypothetical protein
VHLLPAFDEYLVGYANRSAVLDPRFTKQVNAGGGILKPAVVIEGQVVGTWSRRLANGRVDVAVRPFSPLNRLHRSVVDLAIKRYATFLGFAPSRAA